MNPTSFPVSGTRTSPPAKRPPQQTRELPAEPVRQSTRLPGPLLAERQIHPTEPMAISLAPACDPGHHSPGTGDDQPSPAQAIRQEAHRRAATGPASLFGAEGIHAEELNQRLLGHLCTDTPVDDLDLVLYMISRHVPLQDKAAMVQISPETLSTSLLHDKPQLISFLFGSLPYELRDKLMATPALATRLIRDLPYSFSSAPKEVRTQAVLAPLLEDMQKGKRDLLLQWIANVDLDLALSLAPPQDVIKWRPRSLARILPKLTGQDRIEVCAAAVQRHVDLLQLVKGMVDECDYQKLCDLALTVSGTALQYMDDSDRTADRVDKAVAHRQAPHIGAIPKPLLNETRLRLALENSSGNSVTWRRGTPASAVFIQWNLWDTLTQQEKWLNYLPDHERTEALCCQYVAQNPARADCGAIPWFIREQHPQWRDALCEPSLYLPLDIRLGKPSYRVHAARMTALLDDTSSNVRRRPQPQPEDHTQPWALLLAGCQDQLPQSYKQRIWLNGGTAGLGEVFNAPPFRIAPQALLDPIQQMHCTNRAAWLPGQVARKLMFCDHFQPRNAALGLQLHQQMLSEAKALQRAITQGQLDVITPTGTWKLRGGRTLVRTEEDGCLHMKFQRQGESLDSFAAERAVQNFANKHKDLGWHSEIPRSGGIQLVRLDALPVNRHQFPDTLKIYHLQGIAYALAFSFTTEDDSYDTLAWKPDTQGGFEQASQGLLRAFHDLGVWSSLGAVHTSTICLYHHFYESEASRPQLLLSEFFRPGEGYPGTLHLWNTQATAQSDWGWSGLRDLGDLEFYLFLHIYVASCDAEFMIPDYGQRASFVNAVAQNILGGLLHYMRLHRACDPDYHYKKTQSVADLAHFIEQSCNTFLEGLLGEKVPLEQLFEETQQGLAEAYPEWLRRTAEEIIYWSARQDNNSDCLAEHLSKEGRPSPQ
ncbi:MAG: hypothetical protein OXC07_10325, partial [Kistimonas sp.]|nr:hypothetical protein [Kistimonas sp.]